MHIQVRQCMRTDLVLVHPETPVSEVTDLMIAHDIAGVAVVDGYVHLVGWIPETALLVRSLAELGHPFKDHERDGWHFARRQRCIHGRTAADLMIPRTAVVVVQDVDDVGDTVELMLSHHITRMPVLRGDRVVGYLTRADVLRVTRLEEESWARRRLTDEQITQNVRETLRLCTHLADDQIAVRTERGVVKTSGTVASLGHVEHMDKLIRALPGVHGVVNNLVVEGLLH